MSASIAFALCLFFVLLPWVVMVTVLVNRAVANYRQWKSTERELDPGDRDFLRLCYVTLMVAIWLKGL